MRLLRGAPRRPVALTNAATNAANTARNRSSSSSSPAAPTARRAPTRRPRARAPRGSRPRPRRPATTPSPSRSTRLVVVGVDPDRRGLQRGGQARARRDRDRVPGVLGRIARRRSPTRRTRSQRSQSPPGCGAASPSSVPAAHDVEHLHPAADAEHRQPARERAARQRRARTRRGAASAASSSGAARRRSAPGRCPSRSPSTTPSTASSTRSTSLRYGSCIGSAPTASSGRAYASPM